MYKKMLLGAALLSTTGCTTFGVHRMFDNNDGGFVMLAGDAQGIQAYNDGHVGLVTEARNNPDLKSAYWQNREKETTVRGLRFQRKATKGGQ